MCKQPSVTAAMMGCTTLALALALPIDLGIFPWVLLAARVWWLLPDWVGKWCDVRNR